MSETSHDQARMLESLPRHKEIGREHEFLPRYAYVGKLLANFKYDQNELNLLSQWIANIKPYDTNDDVKR